MKDLVGDFKKKLEFKTSLVGGWKGGHGVMIANNKYVVKGF